MATENPSNSPLHGKRVFVYIGRTGESNNSFVSYATEFSINLTPQNTARAVTLGTDAVTDVETHGLAARARINLFLTPKHADILLALDGSADLEEGVSHELDYTTNISEYIGETKFAQTARLNIVIAALNNPPEEVDSGTITLESLKSKVGYVITLTYATVVGFEITGRVGEYATARLEVETGRFKADINKSTPTESE